MLGPIKYCTNQKQNFNKVLSTSGWQFEPIAGDNIHVESAGLVPKPINPLVVEVMQELGYDLSQATSDSVFDFFKEGRLYDYVITVCDETAAGQCPVFPGITKRLTWPFTDPETLTGNHKEQLDALRVIRDQIRDKLTGWLKTI